MFNIIDMRNGSSNPLNWKTSKIGDWLLEANTSTLYYLVMFFGGKVIYLLFHLKEANSGSVDKCIV